MNKKIKISFLGIYILSLFSFVTVPTITFAQSDACPIANSHQVGDQCFCDDYYEPSGGQCVPMSQSQVCPVANSHRVGDQCLCDDGFYPVGGKCISPQTYCSLHHATFSSAINDCKCNEGYEENSTHDDCVAITKPAVTTPPPTPAPTPEPTSATPPEPTPATTPTSTSSTQSEQNPTSEPGEVKLSEPAVTPAPDLLDPAQAIIDLKDSSKDAVGNQPVLDQSLQDLPADQKKLADEQKQVINDLLNSDEGSVQLGPTEDQKIDIIKAAVGRDVANQIDKWDQAVKDAEQKGKVKNAADKPVFDDLANKELALLNQLQQNQDSLKTMHMQALAYAHNDTPLAASLQKDIPNTPTRNFIKETQGDPTAALSMAVQAISEQYKLLDKIKADLKKVKEDKQKLLDVPPKPDLDSALKQIKVDWYK